MKHQPCVVVLAAVLGIGAAFPAGAEFEAPTPGPSTAGNQFNPKLWEVWARTYGGYDDNVVFVANGDPFFLGETDSPYVGVMAGGLFRYPVTEGLTLGVAAEVEKIWHLDDQDDPDITASEQRSYDWLSVSPTAFAEYSFDVAGMPTLTTLAYNFRKDYRPDHADSEALGLDSHSVSLSGNLKPIRDLEFGTSFSYEWHDLEVEFPDPELDDQDGEQWTLGVTGRWYFDRHRRSIGLSYAYSENDATGRNFDYTGHTIGLDSRNHIYGPVYGSVSVSYAWYDYRGFISGFVPQPGRDYEHILETGSTVYWYINQWVTADVYVQYQDFSSNNDLFSGDRTNVGGGLTVRY